MASSLFLKKPVHVTGFFMCQLRALTVADSASLDGGYFLFCFSAASIKAFIGSSSSPSAGFASVPMLPALASSASCLISYSGMGIRSCSITCSGVSILTFSMPPVTRLGKIMMDATMMSCKMMKAIEPL